MMTRAFLVSVVTLVLAGCGASGTADDTVTADQTGAKAKLPSSSLPVPIVRQLENYTCGAASSSAVFKYWSVDGYDGDYHSIMGADLLATDPNNGTDPENIVKTAEHFGLHAEFHAWFPPVGTPSGSATEKSQGAAALAELRDAVSKRHPVILDLQAWSGEKTPNYRRLSVDGHYVVLVGIDADDTGNAYVMDPDAMDDNAPDAYTYLPIQDLLGRWHDYEGSGKNVTRFKFGRIVVYGDGAAPKGKASAPGALIPMG